MGLCCCQRQNEYEFLQLRRRKLDIKAQQLQDSLKDLKTNKEMDTLSTTRFSRRSTNTSASDGSKPKYCSRIDAQQTILQTPVKPLNQIKNYSNNEDRPMDEENQSQEPAF